MRKKFILILLFLSAACTSKQPKEINIKQVGWVEQSNKIAKEYALDDANRYPESASAMGFSEYDSKAIQLEDDMETKDLRNLEKWKLRLEEELLTVKDPNLRIDLEVLANNVKNGIQWQMLDDKYGDIPFYDGSKKIFKSLLELINEQSGVERKIAAVERFKIYVNGHNEFRPLLEAYQSRILYKEKIHSKIRYYALKSEVEQYLSESTDYINGIKQLLEKSGRSDWNNDFEKFRSQIATYDKFIRLHYLPRSRTDFRMPIEIYENILKVRGIDAKPNDLIKMATKDYIKTYETFKNLGKEIAKKYNLKASDPIAVIKYLKSKQVTKTEDVKKLYQNSADFLSKIIKENNLISLPGESLRIRFSGLAESKANPVPHLTLPPLIGNRGERPEFVVPSTGDDKLPFDDFSFEAAALIMTAHEGRPGHDLQFSSMLDNGISIIRARYAFNNVNVEGWALYAEDLVFPFVPIESQFIALQTRLWRIARAFLDPQIQLGKIESSRVKKLFTRELGVSDTMANLELQRYTWEDPGQAPSYYYGLKKILKAKEVVQKSLGNSFSNRCFNDAVIGMGMLPADLVAKSLANDLKCTN